MSTPRASSHRARTPSIACPRDGDTPQHLRKINLDVHPILLGLSPQLVLAQGYLASNPFLRIKDLPFGNLTKRWKTTIFNIYIYISVCVRDYISIYTYSVCVGRYVNLCRPFSSIFANANLPFRVPTKAQMFSARTSRSRLSLGSGHPRRMDVIAMAWHRLPIHRCFAHKKMMLFPLQTVCKNHVGSS